MSRLTELIAQAKAKDPQFGSDLEREFKALSSRRAFGLNFERHRPETVELPKRHVKKGDKVRVLPPRGATEKGDQRLWAVKSIETVNEIRVAHLEVLESAEPESQDVAVDDLVVVAGFRDVIYPGLTSTGKVERGGDKPFHTVINGENYHALKALTYTHRGKVDAIYIDPPYNKGTKDWKYNNDYVEKEDIYRHSKWLAFMERRLKVAQELLNPTDSVLIVTIDEKEYLRLGLLLEQTFPGANIQMVSSIINSKGTSRENEFSRTNEFIFMVLFGAARISPLEITAGDKPEKVEWQTFRRRDIASARGTKKGGPAQFYPIYVNLSTGLIEEIGEPLPHNVSRHDAPQVAGCEAVFPVRPDGTEMNWALTVPSLRERLSKGYVRAGNYTGEAQPYIIQYFKSGPIKDIEEGRASIVGYNDDGSVIAAYTDGTQKIPTTQWDVGSHSAEHYGTNLLTVMLPDRRFPFPKSLYAVEDALRFFIKDKPDAVILDFFSGSGTTAHAVMRLNRQDGGRRQCISVTNNEVAVDEQATLRKQGLRPGDPGWEQWGICDYITKPRVEAAITGKTPNGESIKGDYKFTDEFPMAEGFEENAEFFTLTYQTPVAVSHNHAFEQVAPLLWMRAGSQGKRIQTLPDEGWEVVDSYGLLTDLDRAAAFCKAVASKNGLRVAFIVTNDDRRFQAVARRLPESVESVRLYESYLLNFRFANGE